MCDKEGPAGSQRSPATAGEHEQDPHDVDPDRPWTGVPAVGSYSPRREEAPGSPKTAMYGLPPLSLLAALLRIDLHDPDDAEDVETLAFLLARRALHELTRTHQKVGRDPGSSSPLRLVGDPANS